MEIVPEFPTDPQAFPDHLWISDPLDITFEGFSVNAFQILDRLKEHPYIDQYRKEKEGFRTHIQAPFKRYRDDLVVNAVLPNRLPLETERNVFSRILKNDFGAGGCHHHLWMSFYRPDFSRLRDVQLAHSLSPDGLYISVYVGAQAKSVYTGALQRMKRQEKAFLACLNPLLHRKRWRFAWRPEGEKRHTREALTDPVDELPTALFKSREFWVRSLIERESVLERAGEVFYDVFDRLQEAWPLYRFLL